MAKLQILMKIRTPTILWEKTISKNRDTQESSIQANDSLKISKLSESPGVDFILVNEELKGLW